MFILYLIIYHILNRIAHMLLLYIIIAHFTKNTIFTIYIIKVFIFLLFTLLRFFLFEYLQGITKYVLQS